jgi:hypothetical protein
MKKPNLAAAIFSVAATLTLSNAAFADGYPSRPVTFIGPTARAARSTCWRAR